MLHFFLLANEDQECDADQKKIRNVIEVGRAAEISSVSFNKNEEMHWKAMAMPMKIDAMQKEIEDLKVATQMMYARQELQKNGHSKGEVLSCTFVF